jgi:virginiamycin B lyase
MSEWCEARRAWRVLRWVVVATFALSAVPGSVSAAAPTVTEFPTVGYPRHITAGPDGNLWFTEPQENRIGRITAAGNVVEFPASGGPMGITAGPDGNIWATQFDTRRVDKVELDGDVTPYGPGTGTSAGRRGITMGADGNLWFVESGYNDLGFVTPAGADTVSGTPSPNADPHDITAGPDGALWFTEPGLDAIGRMTTGSVVTNEFHAGVGGGASPWSITTGPDGNLWFTEPGLDRIGRITPTGTVREFSDGISADAGPNDIVAGPDGNLWFTEAGVDRIGRITPLGEVTEFSGGITAAASLEGITVGPDGNLWFAESDQTRIGRINTATDPFFRNATPLKVPASGTSGPASLYPSPIDVSGLAGTVTDVNVSLTGISHAFVPDLEFLLVGPQGQAALLTSDVGSSNPDPHGVGLTIDDEAPYSLPTASGAPVVSGMYRPTDLDNAFPDVFPAPAPAGPYSTQLSSFDGTAPNGTWQLFAVDDSNSDVGNLFGGWGLDIQTTGPPPDDGPGGGGAAPDTKVELSLNAATKQKLKKLAVEVGCADEACTLNAAGTAVAKPKNPGKLALRKKKFTLASTTASAAAGEIVKLSLKVEGKKPARALAKLVKKGAKAKSNVVVTATDSAGNVDQQTVTIGLKK